jgi:ribonuclease R
VAKRSKFKAATRGRRDPARDILHALELAGEPLTPKELAKRLRVPRPEKDSFEQAVAALERAAEIVRNRAGSLLVAKRIAVVAGRIEGHRDGHGFLFPDDGSPQVFLPPAEMREVLHGDRAAVRVVGRDQRGRPSGVIVEVLERGKRRIVGRLHTEHGVTFLVPEDRRIAHDILVPPAEIGRAKAGEVVTVDLIAQPSKHAQPIGRVAEVLGNYADPGMEIEIAVRKFDLPNEFSKRSLAAAQAMPEGVRSEDLAGRKDLRELEFVTIDGETARDFDDAVFCRREGKGFRLWVAIADVSHYVRHGDALDTDARERGTSVYFPRRVIPMLPEKLSNGLCSLNPKVPRLAMVCDMQVDARGEIGSYRFYPAVFRSHARLTYTEVAAMLEDAGSEAASRHRALLPHVRQLHRLYKVLVKARERRGAIDFETIETEMVFDAHGKIERIVQVKRNDAHRVIEECMLAANVCASMYLRQHDQPMLYRIHEGPTPEKLAALREFLKGFGLNLSGGDKPHAADYAKLLNKVKDRPDAQLLQTVMLRSLRQAIYSPDNVGHFGLAYESYTHFTSPIRRYPDLLIHRAIKAVLAAGRYQPGAWSEIGLHCSMTERRADEATRDVEAWLKCYYMQDRIGEEFAGSISSVVPFGIFVALDDVFIEGLVHVSDLGRDYFHFDEAGHAMVGERTGRRFRLSDRIRVQLVRVDMEQNKIDFRLVEDAAASADEVPRTKRREQR